MKKMRILFINSIQMFGGGEIWLFRTMQEMQKRGHRVHLLCRPDVPLEAKAMENGFDVHTLRMSGDFDPRTICSTYKLIRKLRPDVVCTNMDKELRFGGLAATWAGVKAVVPRRGIDHPLKNTWTYRFSYNRLASGVIANSEATKRSLLRNSPWLDPKKIRVIYNGVDINAFTSPPKKNLRREFGIGPTDFVFGFVGQLDERKGVDTLVDAFHRLSLSTSNPRVGLLIVGEGKLEPVLRRKVQHVKRKVVFAGFRNDVDEIMKTIDVLVLPSLWEGFGIVLIEAMAAGKPVITTRVSNMPEIVNDGENGFLVPPSDPDALRIAMEAMVANPRRIRHMGQNGQRMVQTRFTLKSMVDATEDYFWELCTRK